MANQEDHHPAYNRLCAYVRQTALLESTAEILGWDERTMLPPSGGDYRAEQVAHLSGLIHERQTDPVVGQWLDELADSPLAHDPHSDSGVTIHQLKREFEKKVKLPRTLVKELARISVLGQQAWAKSRKDNDFPSFEPLLRRIIELKQQQAEALGYSECPYDALLDDFESDELTSNVARVLEDLRRDLVPLVQAIITSGRAPNREVLKRRYPVGAQEAFGKTVASRIGFDFDRGRLDVTDHPFCSSMGPDDCRITTRYNEHFFPTAFFGIMHEAGHGIYDQGLRRDQFGLPPGTYVSLGIHESQSRMWENLVGRSRAFWMHHYPEAQRAFPEALNDVAFDEFYFAVNDVRPSLIRVEADEATYNLHIIVRFELEQALINGSLSVADLPGAWNEKYQEYFDLLPPDDADGVLQDIHWGATLIGYFPTYSLGNLYAAQLFQAADSELGGVDGQFARGEFTPLRDWLRENIHRHGQCYTAAQLAANVTGRPLDHIPLINQLRTKLEPLFGI